MRNYQKIKNKIMNVIDHFGEPENASDSEFYVKEVSVRAIAMCSTSQNKVN